MGHGLPIAIPSTNEVAVVDIPTMRVVMTIKVPASPQEVLIRPDGRSLTFRAPLATRLPRSGPTIGV